MRRSATHTDGDTASTTLAAELDVAGAFGGDPMKMKGSAMISWPHE